MPCQDINLVVLQVGKTTIIAFMKHLFVGFFGTFMIIYGAYAQEENKHKASLSQGYVGINIDPYAPVNAEKPEDRPANPVKLQANKVKAGEVFNVVHDKPEHQDINTPKYYLEKKESTKPE